MELKIGKHTIGENHPCYIIAEMSGNHAGSLENAKKIVRKAKEIGADAIKLQTYRPDTITLDSDNPDFQLTKDCPWKEKNTLFQLYQQAYTPWEWHQELFELAREIDLDIFSSPFDHTAIDLLEELGAPAYKIASPEITDIPLIRRVAQTGKPVIFSTGLARLEDIELAVQTLKEAKCEQFAILKCTSAYPTPIDQANLANIPELKKRYQCVSGLSDHTKGINVPAISVALGGRIIEKHFTLTEIGESVDSFFSLNENEFQEMIESVRLTEKAIGNVDFEVAPAAIDSLHGRRSLYVSKDIAEGEMITSENIKSVRPSMGLHPKHYDQVLGMVAKKPLQFGQRLQLEDLQEK